MTRSVPAAATSRLHKSLSLEPDRPFEQPMSVLQRLLAVRKADANLPAQVRIALVDSLYAPVASLIVGAASGGVVGTMVWLRVDDPRMTLCSLAIFLAGIGRVLSSVAYHRRSVPLGPDDALFWERAYRVEHGPM